MNSVKLEPTFFFTREQKKLQLQRKGKKREITAIIEQKWNKVEDEDLIWVL